MLAASSSETKDNLSLAVVDFESGGRSSVYFVWSFRDEEVLVQKTDEVVTLLESAERSCYHCFSARCEDIQPRHRCCDPREETPGVPA